MLKRVSVTSYVVDYMKKLSQDEVLTGDEEDLVKTIINEFTQENVVEILNITSVAVNLTNLNEYNVIDFKDVNIKPQRIIEHYGNYTVESNEYVFVLCVEGTATMEGANDDSKQTYSIKKGDAVNVNLKTKYKILTNDKNLQLVVVAYVSRCPFVHYKNVVFSEDSVVFDAFVGCRFALFRLVSDYDEEILEDILVLNGTYYHSCSMKKANIISLKSILTKYSLYPIELDYVPNSGHPTELELLELSLDEDTVQAISNGTSYKQTCSLSGTRYKLLIVYGVTCYSFL
ncbi:m124R [Myxoma virus]|nr:m124R [Myxoma virus]